MSSQGPLSPGTVADDSGVGSAAWSNPSNAVSSNNSYATAAISFVASSHYLKATNFSFSIPAGATINGIVVEWEKSDATESGAITDLRARIVKGGTIGSTDKSSGTAWPSVDAYTTYGTSSDLWGETWTASNINASDFGAVIAAQATGPGSIANIDHIRITVYYTDAAWDASQWSQGVMARGGAPLPVMRSQTITGATEPTNWSAFDNAAFPRCQVGRGGPVRPTMRSRTDSGATEPLAWTVFDLTLFPRSYIGRGALSPLSPMRGAIVTPSSFEPTAPIDGSTTPPAMTFGQAPLPPGRGSTLVAYGKMVDPEYGEQELPRVFVARGRVIADQLARGGIASPVPQPEAPTGFDGWAIRRYPAMQPQRRAGQSRLMFLPEMSGPPFAQAVVGQPRRLPPRSIARITDPFEPVLPWPSRWALVNARSVRPVPVSRSLVANVFPTLAELPAGAYLSAPRLRPPRGSGRAVFLPDFPSARLQALPLVTMGTGRAVVRASPRPVVAFAFDSAAVADVLAPRALVTRPSYWRQRAWWPQTRLFWTPQTIVTYAVKDDRDGTGGGGKNRTVSGASGRAKTGTGNPAQ